MLKKLAFFWISLKSSFPSLQFHGVEKINLLDKFAKPDQLILAKKTIKVLFLKPRNFKYIGCSNNNFALREKKIWNVCCLLFRLPTLTVLPIKCFPEKMINFLTIWILHFTKTEIFFSKPDSTPLKTSVYQNSGSHHQIISDPQKQN